MAMSEAHQVYVALLDEAVSVGVPWTRSIWWTTIICSAVRFRRVRSGSFGQARSSGVASENLRMALAASWLSPESNVMPNPPLERTAGSHALAAAAQRDR